MNTKLTLVMEDEVIYKAKSYAQKKGTSLSSLVENYLKTVANDEKPNKDANLLKHAQLHPKVAKLKGVLNLPAHFNYKEEITKALVQKRNKLKWEIFI